MRRLAPSRTSVTLIVTAIGARIALTLVSSTGGRAEAFAERLATAWARCQPVVVRGARSESAVTEVDLDDGRDGDALRADITSLVTRAGIDRAAGDHVLLHAAGCSDDATGLAAVLVGPSGRGKTTAAIALGARFGYLTDETVAVRRDGTIVPYPKPLSVVDETAPAKRQVAPDAAGLRPAASRPWPLGAVVLLDRINRIDREGDPPAALDPPSVVHLDLATALLALAPELSHAARVDGCLARIAALLDGCGPVVRVRYREAEQLPGVIGVLLAARGAARSAPRTARTGWRSLESAPRSPGTGDPTRDRVRRVEALDALETEGTLVVQLPDRFVSAGGLAPAIWEAAGSWRSLDDLVAILAAQLGRPEDAPQRVAAAVDSLHRAGLLDRGTGAS